MPGILKRAELSAGYIPSDGSCPVHISPWEPETLNTNIVWVLHITLVNVLKSWSLGWLIRTFMCVIFIFRYLSHNSHTVAGFFWEGFHKSISKPSVQVQFLNLTCDNTQNPKCLRITFLKAISHCKKSILIGNGNLILIDFQWYLPILSF